MWMEAMFKELFCQFHLTPDILFNFKPNNKLFSTWIKNENQKAAIQDWQMPGILRKSSKKYLNKASFAVRKLCIICTIYSTGTKLAYSFP